MHNLKWVLSNIGYRGQLKLETLRVGCNAHGDKRHHGH